MTGHDFLFKVQKQKTPSIRIVRIEGDCYFYRGATSFEEKLLHLIKYGI